MLKTLFMPIVAIAFSLNAVQAASHSPINEEKVERLFTCAAYYQFEDHLRAFEERAGVPTPRNETASRFLTAAADLASGAYESIEAADASMASRLRGQIQVYFTWHTGYGHDGKQLRREMRYPEVLSDCERLLGTLGNVIVRHPAPPSADKPASALTNTPAVSANDAKFVRIMQKAILDQACSNHYGSRWNTHTQRALKDYETFLREHLDGLTDEHLVAAQSVVADAAAEQSASADLWKYCDRTLADGR